MCPSENAKISELRDQFRKEFRDFLAKIRVSKAQGGGACVRLADRHTMAESAHTHSVAMRLGNREGPRSEQRSGATAVETEWTLSYIRGGRVGGGPT